MLKFNTVNANNFIQNIIITIQKKRTNPEIRFNNICEEKIVMAKLEINIKFRTIKRQTQRHNTPTNFIETVIQTFNAYTYS